MTIPKEVSDYMRGMAYKSNESQRGTPMAKERARANAKKRWDKKRAHPK